MDRWSSQTVLVIAVVLALAAPAGAAEPERPRSIVVVGSGKVDSAPDAMQVGFAVEETAPSAEEARNAAAKRAKSVLDALKGAAGEKARVETAGFSLMPVYKPDPEPRMGRKATPPEIVAYTAVHQIRVESRRVDAAGAILDAGVRAGAARIQGLSFSLAEPATAEDEALQRAGADARRQAEAVARALDVGLGRILEAVVEGRVRPMFESHGRFAAMTADAAVETPVAPGEVTTEAQIRVTYGIE